MSRHLRNSSCSSAVQRPVALGMDLASRARALFWALLGAFGPATVLDVNDAKSFFSAAAFATVLGAVVVVRAGAAGVMAAGPAGVGAFTDINLWAGGLVLSPKGEKRCGESAAGFWAMQVINTAILYVQDALDIATNLVPNFAAKHAPANSRVLKSESPYVSKRQQAPSFGRGTPKKMMDSKNQRQSEARLPSRRHIPH